MSYHFGSSHPRKMFTTCVHRSTLAPFTTSMYGAPVCDETAVNPHSFQNLKSSLYCSRLQRFPQYCLKHEKRSTIDRYIVGAAYNLCSFV